MVWCWCMSSDVSRTVLWVIADYLVRIMARLIKLIMCPIRIWTVTIGFLESWKSPKYCSTSIRVCESVARQLLQSTPPWPTFTIPEGDSPVNDRVNLLLISLIHLWKHHLFPPFIGGIVAESLYLSLPFACISLQNRASQIPLHQLKMDLKDPDLALFIPPRTLSRTCEVTLELLSSWWDWALVWWYGCC
jgi:hypothetical protein